MRSLTIRAEAPRLASGFSLVEARLPTAFGILVAAIAWVDSIRFVRVDLLTSRDPSWAVPRLVLCLGVIAFTAFAGGLAAGGFLLWQRLRAVRNPAPPLPFRRATLAAVAVAALIFGASVRLAWLDRIPSAVWYDEIAAVHPMPTLSGRWTDFRDALRAMPYDDPPRTAAGVLYLEFFRCVWNAVGPGMTALRLPGALEGILSLVTAYLLARRFLPKGGATVAILVLAGLRWQIIMARFGWNTLALAPILDLATLCLVTARRRGVLWAAAAGGFVAGIGAHVYLAAWIAGVALGGFLLWPGTPAVPARRRVLLACLFGVGFLAAASPIFLFHQGRRASYFGRADDQNLLIDYRRTHDWSIPLTVVVDAFQAPWLLPDPEPRQDLPVSRLGWIFGVPVAVGLLRALTRPRADLSALIFAHAGAAVLATLRWGFPGHPNGFRFVYLTTVTAVVAADGVLCLVGMVPAGRRRLAAIAALGLLAVGSVLGAREALFDWGESRRTLGMYSSGTTLIARAELRWRHFGQVRLDADVPDVPKVEAAILAHGLDPDFARDQHLFPSADAAPKKRCIRIASSTTAAAARSGERVVEILQDGWGTEYGAVLARPCVPGD